MAKPGFKIRLWKGPFDGKVMEHYPDNLIVVAGPKRMSKKQRYQWERENYHRISYDPAFPANPSGYPIVRATYRKCYGPTGYAMQHPDGSYFYEFTGDKKEF